MADLVITATSVVPAASAKLETGVAGEAITAGQMVYKAAASGKFFKADCDSATAEVRSPVGLAVNGGAANQPLTIVKKGQVTLGAVLTEGVGYYLSGTAGGICPVADLGSGDYPVFLGFAISPSVLNLDMVEAGVDLA